MAELNCIGIDGCRTGWVAATRDGVTVHEALGALLEQLDVLSQPSVVAIDMPIGLAATGQRACDHEARRCLDTARGNSVFWTATRGAVYAPGHDLDPRAAHTEASRANIANKAGGVSAQAFNLFPKIREVDALLAARPALKGMIFEVHPELAFAAWHADAPHTLRPMPHPKKSGLGAYDRLRLVFDRYGREAFEQTRRDHAAARVADDDIADAYAALYSAERIARGVHVTLPHDPAPRDATGLPMRICY